MTKGKMLEQATLQTTGENDPIAAPHLENAQAKLPLQKDSVIPRTKGNESQTEAQQ